MHKESSNNVKKKSKRFKSKRRIFKKIFPDIPNTRLRLHLKEHGLDAFTCKDLQKVLKLEQDLTDTKVQIAYKFHRYKWEIKVKNSQTFKRALAVYQQNNPDIDIFSEDMFPKGPIIQYIGYLLGGIFGSIQFIISIFP